MVKVMHVCGARPNFIKIAAMMAACRDHPEVETLLVHTGQHYDPKMSDLFFRELGIPEPDLNLGVGSASQARQTAEIMLRFEPVVLEHAPDWVVVVGDVNSTIACSLVSAKLGVKVAHVEAGLRSHDYSMPEEINRILTDRISDLLFVTERGAVENLRREGIDSSRIRFVGNVMIDTLLSHRNRAERSTIVQELGLERGGYAVVTLHRPSNVDDPSVLASILRGLGGVGEELPVIFPIHPRTRQRIETFDLVPDPTDTRLRLVDPMGYLDFLKLMGDARVVLTDSGGMQEETTILGLPCMTLRKNTERPVTIEQGTNRLVDPDEHSIAQAWQDLRRGAWGAATGAPELWDGKAAQRIVRCLLDPGGRPPKDP